MRKEPAEHGAGAPVRYFRYCGRGFTPVELDTIRALTMSLPTRALDWRRPDGATKALSARVALNRMAADGLITLPSPRNTNGRHPRHRPDTSHPSRSTSLTNLGTLQLHRFTWSAPEPDSAHYNELIATRHYLGHTLLAGAQLRYLIHARPGSWPP